MGSPSGFGMFKNSPEWDIPMKQILTSLSKKSNQRKTVFSLLSIGLALAGVVVIGEHPNLASSSLKLTRRLGLQSKVDSVVSQNEVPPQKKASDASLPAQATDFTLKDDATVVAKWDQAILKAIGNSDLGPTPASRALALVHTSIFDAWAAYDPVAIGTRLGDSLQVAPEQITLENKQEAISYAAYRTLVDLFPSQTHVFNQLMNDLGYDYTNKSTDTKTAAGIGNKVAQALLDFRHKDGSNQSNNYADTVGYQPINPSNKVVDPHYWQSLKIDGKVQKFLTPHWGDVTPFALKSGNQFLPPPPPTYGSRQYMAGALEVIKLNAELTDEQKVIAEYWADGPGSVMPAGHWHLFGEFVSQRDDHTLDEDVKMFFILGNASFDAGIAAWHAKAYYDYVRPITAIRYLATKKMLPESNPHVRTNPQTGVQEILSWGGPNQGSKWVKGSDWLPYQKITFVTPAFAEYVSGHSTFSTAGAEILKRFTGSDNFGAQHVQQPNSSTYESSTPQEPVVLRWDTFTAAANESGLSRLYGGIHFRDGDLNGRTLGRLVAAEVWHKAQYYINGGK